MNKEQGMLNVEVFGSDRHSAFLVPCMLFCIFLLLQSFYKIQCLGYYITHDRYQ